MTNDSDVAGLLAEDTAEFEAERLILDATEVILELMDREGVTRSELAERIGKSKGHVSQLLNGERNMTLRTLAEIVHAVGYRIALEAHNRARRRMETARPGTSHDPRSVFGLLRQTEPEQTIASLHVLAHGTRFEKQYTRYLEHIAPAPDDSVLLLTTQINAQRHHTTQSFFDSLSSLDEAMNERDDDLEATIGVA